MKPQLVLSLFPGADLLGLAFEREGFAVVQGPDVIFGRDVRRFHVPAGRFDGVIGGPPCQPFSALVHLVRACGNEPRHPNLIPEFERIVAESECAWFLMEEVPAAPVPVVPGYAIHSFVIRNDHIDPDGDGIGEAQIRKRRFSFGVRGAAKPIDLRRWVQWAALDLPDPARTVMGTEGQSGSGGTLSSPPTKERSVTANPDRDGDRPGQRPPRTKERPVMTGHGNSLGAAGWDGGPKTKNSKAPPVPAREGHGAGWDSIPNPKRTKAHAVVARKDTGQDFTRQRNPKEGTKSPDRPKRTLEMCCELQGLPRDFLAEAPFTKSAKYQLVGNGVPLSLGLTMARAIKAALGPGNDA